MSATTSMVHGQPSWRLANKQVSACITQLGGHLAPVTFDRPGAALKPYAVAPWCRESLPGQPNIIKALRGDFFCLPFGGNDTPHRGEQHPVHGETANRKWRFVAREKTATTNTLHLRLRTKTRPGTVDKFVQLQDGHNAVYLRHVLTGFRGRMNPGHHATLRFPDHEGSGLLSCSPFVHGQVFPEPTEDPAAGGYSILEPGAVFDDLRAVRTITGASADLSRYPARRGFEDIAILVADPDLDVAWTAVSFPAEGYVWFALKDPSVLASTLLWMSNGGRHYPPWSGRHVNVMGLEEVTAFFHLGLHESVTKNALNAAGHKTWLRLSPRTPTTINYIMACVPAPAGFDRVADLTPTDDGQTVTLTSASNRRLTVPLDVAFLRG